MLTIQHDLLLSVDHCGNQALVLISSELLGSRDSITAVKIF
jgi:hypothetical protein